MKMLTWKLKKITKRLWGKKTRGVKKTHGRQTTLTMESIINRQEHKTRQRIQIDPNDCKRDTPGKRHEDQVSVGGARAETGRRTELTLEGRKK